MGIRPAASSKKSASPGKSRLAPGLREWLFPLTRCVVCRRAAYDGLCDACRSQIRFWSGPMCAQCSAPLSEPGICGECYTDEPPFSRAEYVALHRPPWAGAITSFKYAGRKYKARALARFAFRQCEATGLLDGLDCAVPVPLHPKARLKRGFNQCELICRELALLSGVPCEPGLIRVKSGEPQVTLTGPQRRANIRGAFKPRSPAAVKGKRVLLVDDVYTTGATIREAAKALKRGGAVEVRVLTLARAATGSTQDRESPELATGDFDFADPAGR